MPRIEGVTKGKGSVEDGVEHIKSYQEVVIHTRCIKTQEEFRKYGYKVDRLSGDILPVIVDDWNHYIDAIRYALEPIMKLKSSGGVFLPRRMRGG
ncbi:Terminase RNAseH like domain protein [compost metagenome]